MNTETLEALKGSIKKWKKIIKGTGVDEGSENCPLCKLFIYQYCKDCPVMEKTELDSCKNTPYGEWCRHQEKYFEEGLKLIKVRCPTCKRLAKKELGFLKSLLPKKKVEGE